MKNKIKIDVVSDIACPWCFIGKKNLEIAIKNSQNYDVTINWLPYQLDPTIPLKGLDRITYLTSKFGDVDFDKLGENIVTAGKNVGINFVKINRATNTLKMHCLLHEANKQGFGNELNEALFKSYFEDSIDLTQDTELCIIMSNFGWAAELTMEVLKNDDISYEVKQEISKVQSRGVTGVPYFIINDKYTISGAQPPDVFIDAIKDIGKEFSTEPASACDIDDPNC